MADAMPGAAPAPTMEDFAAFEQIRQEVSPSELNETLLAKEFPVKDIVGTQD